VYYLSSRASACEGVCADFLLAPSRVDQ